MKSLFFYFAFLITTGAMGQTTIEFKLTGEIYKGSDSVEMDVSSINKVLKKKKMRLLPETVTFGAQGVGKWKKLMKQLAATRSALKKDIDLVLNRGYLYEFPAMCYRGKLSEVSDVVESLMGTVLHADQELLASKFGTNKVVHQDREFFESNKSRFKAILANNPVEVKLWQNYKKSSDTFLLLSDYGPQGDGTELTATEIKPCKQ